MRLSTLKKSNKIIIISALLWVAPSWAVTPMSNNFEDAFPFAFKDKKEESPSWMTGVGRLLILGNRCSLVLIKTPGENFSTTAVSAQHCLKDALVTPGNKEENAIKGYQILRGRFQTLKGENIERDLILAQHGGSDIGADWAIFKFKEPVMEDAAHSFKVAKDTPYMMDKEIAVGHSTILSSPSGSYGNVLRYDSQCHFEMLLKATGGDVVRVRNCEMKTGASGGAYIGISDKNKQPILLGIIKGIHKQEQGKGYYVHISTFYDEIKKATETKVY